MGPNETRSTRIVTDLHEMSQWLVPFISLQELYNTPISCQVIGQVIGAAFGEFCLSKRGNGLH
eukprot:4526068-Ditylum_brightwellii.AAC.1